MEQNTNEIMTLPYEGDRLDISPIISYFSKSSDGPYYDENGDRIRPINPDSSHLEGIKKAFRSLLSVSSHLGLTAHLMEFSLYDPENGFERPELGTQRFNVVVACPSDSNRKTYCDLLEANVGGKTLDGPVSKYSGSPLIHHQEIGLSPYYALPRHSGKATKPLTGEIEEMSVGSYGRTLESQVDYGGLRGQIEDFFDECYSRFEGEVIGVSGGEEMNMAILVPLAHKKKTSATEIGRSWQYNGGGIFIFGHAEPSFQVDQFAVVFRNFVNNSLFSIVYDAGEMETMRSQKKLLELNLVHHFKSEMTCKLLYPLESILSQHRNSPQIQELETVHAFVWKFVTKIAELIRATSELSPNTSQYIDFKGFRQKVEEIFASYTLIDGWGIVTEVTSQPSDPQLALRTDLHLLELILQELIKNALSEIILPIIVHDQERSQSPQWVRDVIPLKTERKVVVTWREFSESPARVEIAVFNSDSAIDEEVKRDMDRGGLQPINPVRLGSDKPEYACGLGLKILKGYLRALQATVPPQERAVLEFMIGNVDGTPYGLGKMGVEAKFGLLANT